MYLHHSALRSPHKKAGEYKPAFLCGLGLGQLMRVQLEVQWVNRLRCCGLGKYRSAGCLQAPVTGTGQGGCVQILVEHG